MRDNEQRFSIDLPEELHQLLKLHVLQKGKRKIGCKNTMKHFVWEAICDKLERDISHNKDTINILNRSRVAMALDLKRK